MVIHIPLTQGVALGCPAKPLWGTSLEAQAMAQSHNLNEPKSLREELEDRLADLALQEIHGGRRPPDLSQPVVAISNQPRRSWRTFAKLALAASVLIAAGAGALGWWQLKGTSQRVARVDSELPAAEREEHRSLSH